MGSEEDQKEVGVMVEVDKPEYIILSCMYYPMLVFENISKSYLKIYRHNHMNTDSFVCIDPNPS